jgi:hypothetical protein
VALKREAAVVYLSHTKTRDATFSEGIYGGSQNRSYCSVDLS